VTSTGTRFSFKAAFNPQNRLPELRHGAGPHVQRSFLRIQFAVQDIITFMISLIFLMRWRKLQILCFSSLLAIGFMDSGSLMGMRGSLIRRDRRQQPQRAPAIVIGFLGGMVRHDDAVHSEVQIAADLRKKYPEGVYVATFENRRLADARKAILSALDTDRDGKLSDYEKRNARIILYGHSWGASAVVALARDLNKDGVPVLLTVQVDSVAKTGQNDALIPGKRGGSG